jgi:hypothetical protein
VPAKAAKASAAYKALEGEAALLRADKDRAEAALDAIRARPPVPPAARQSLEAFGLLTGLRISPVAVAGSSAAAPCEPGLGAFRCETEDPESGDAVVFTLDVFRVAPPPLVTASGDGAAAAASASAAGPGFPTGLAVEYTPGEGCEAHLPPFLHAVITFGSEQAPMFLAKVRERERDMALLSLGTLAECFIAHAHERKGDEPILTSSSPPPPPPQLPTRR